MSDTQTLRLEVAQPPKTPTEPKKPKPAGLVIPGKPALATLGMVAADVAAAAAVAPMSVAVAAGAAAAVGVTVAARRAAAGGNRGASRIRIPGLGRTASGGIPKPRATGGGSRLGHGTPNARRGALGRLAGLGGKPKGSPSGGTGGRGSSGAVRGGSTGRGGALGGRTTAGGRTPTGSPLTGRSPRMGGSRTPSLRNWLTNPSRGRRAGRLGAAIGRTGRAVLAGLGASTPREAAKAARESAVTDRHGLIKPGLGAAILAGGLVATRRGIRRTVRGGRWLWRRARRVARRAVGVTEPAPETPDGPGVNDDIREPDPRAIPGSGDPSPTTTSFGGLMGSAPAPVSPFYRLAQELHAAAAKWQPNGMLPIRAELYELPHSLGEIAAAIRKRADACSPANSPLKPAIETTLQQIAAAVDAAAQASVQLGPAMDALHSVEVQRLLAPRANESAWDTSNNV